MVFREEGGREGRREEKRKQIEKERKGKRYKLLLKLVNKRKKMVLSEYKIYVTKKNLLYISFSCQKTEKQI